MIFEFIFVKDNKQKNNATLYYVKALCMQNNIEFQFLNDDVLK